MDFNYKDISPSTLPNNDRLSTSPSANPRSSRRHGRRPHQSRDVLRRTNAATTDPATVILQRRRDSNRAWWRLDVSNTAAARSNVLSAHATTVHSVECRLSESSRRPSVFSDALVVAPTQAY